MINEAVARAAMALATGNPNRRSGAPLHPLRTGSLLSAYCQLCSDGGIIIQKVGFDGGAYGIEIAAHEIAERCGEGNVRDIEIRESHGPQALNVGLGYLRGVAGDLLGIGEHLHLLFRQPGIAVVPSHGKRLIPADHPAKTRK